MEVTKKPLIFVISNNNNNLQQQQQKISIMRTITTIVIFMFSFVFSANSANGQTATKNTAHFFEYSHKNLTISADTQNITVQITPTKGSRIYTEIEYTYSAKGVNLDKLNTLAGIAFQNKRFEISLSNDILTIKKNTKNAIFINNLEGGKTEVIENINVKIYVPESITFVGM